MQPNIPRIYLFYTELGKYDDTIIHLAEGLIALGIKFYSNRNIWRIGAESDETLLKNNREVKYSDCDIVIFSSYYFQYISPINYSSTFSDLPDDFIATKNRFTSILIDPHDGYKTISWNFCNYFDLVLRVKYNNKMYWPNNFLPWVHGFGNRVLKATEKRVLFKDRKHEIIVNYSYSHPFEHGLRRFTNENVLNYLEEAIPLNRKISNKEKKPVDAYAELMWEQTERKHNPDYYNSLVSSTMIAAFCGYLIPGLPRNPSKILLGGKKAKSMKFFFEVISNLSGSTLRSVQWDSWRFWEALTAGCIPMHVDLEKYGVELPIIPQNWKHYIGIDLDQIKKDIGRIIEDKDGLEKISIQGHNWAIENYSPKVSAKRLLNLLGYEI